MKQCLTKNIYLKPSQNIETKPNFKIFVSGGKVPHKAKQNLHMNMLCHFIQFCLKRKKKSLNFLVSKKIK